MTEILYYILLFPLEQLLEWMLYTLFKATKSGALSIILLSLLVNLFLLKIFLYTDKKAKDESELKKKLDSRIKAWKSVYKRAKLYAFTQTLYRQHNYHPIYALRSLLGLLLQIPFFIAMYAVIANADFLLAKPFLWIHDLSKPDSIPFGLFGLESIHLLPILMTLFTLINVMIVSKELGARLQGAGIALLFLVLLYSMPSALVLYWTCNMLFALLKELYKKYKKASEIESIQSNKTISTPNITKSKDLLTISKSNYKGIIFLSIINICVMMFIFNTYALIATDLGQFEASEINIILAASFGCGLLISLIFIYLSSFINSLKVLKITAIILSAVFIIGLLYSLVLTGDYGPMQGFTFARPLILNNTQITIDIIAVICCIMCAYFLNKSRFIKGFYKVSLATLCVVSSFSLYNITIETNSKKDIMQKYANDRNGDNKDDPIFAFSKDKTNILVILLDRADGYTTHRILESNKELRDKFDGFIDFRNALSSGNLTFSTLTSVIGGEYYSALNINKRANKDKTLQSAINDGYANTFNAFQKAGYATAGIIDYPADTEIYKKLDNSSNIVFKTNAYNAEYALYHDVNINEGVSSLSRLISISLFKISPYSIRPYVYRDGRLLLILKHGISGVVEIAEMYALRTRLSNTAQTDTFKFFHNSITHNPYVLDKDCNFVDNSPKNKHPNDLLYGLMNGHYNAESCALKWLGETFDKMKKLGVYDNTEIFITADHGAQYKYLPVKMSFHVPLFYKPMHSRGEMKQDERVIMNYDLASIFCSHLKNGCPNVKTNILENYPNQRDVILYESDWNKIRKINKANYKIDLENYYKYNWGHNEIYDSKNWEKISID
ncbi:membrane protein insertase YidC [Helicobacter muridarum]|nr:membrane protein insertase YidC [Helicobacter muridarum]STQ86751.1 inner membrane protein [Helicobacter muridarum]